MKVLGIGGPGVELRV